MTIAQESFRRPLSTPPLPTSNVTTPSSTPSTTPVKRSSNRYSDRFIPSRAGSGDLRAAFDLLRNSTSSTDSSTCENTPGSSNYATPTSPIPSPAQTTTTTTTHNNPNCYSLLLKSELLDEPPRPPSLPFASASPPPSLPASARLAAKRNVSGAVVADSTDGIVDPMDLSSTAPSSLISTPTTTTGLDGLTRLSSASVLPVFTPSGFDNQHATNATITHAHHLDQAQFLQSPHQLQTPPTTAPTTTAATTIHHHQNPITITHTPTSRRSQSSSLHHPYSLQHHHQHPHPHHQQQTPTTPNMLRFRTGVPDRLSSLQNSNVSTFNNTLSSSTTTTPNSLFESSSDARSALLSAASAASSGRITRKIARAPFKVLDAPCLKDDFYLNLVDWSSRNVLAVGLGSCVYLWSAFTSVVTKLCDLQFGGPVCSVAWSPQGTELAVGTQPGQVQIWDTATCKLLRTMSGHTARAGCLAWNSSVLSSGGRDKEIFNRDLRCKESYIARLSGHRQEVCGLRWSPDESQLASGGNDNKLLIWSSSGSSSSGSNNNSNSLSGLNSNAITNPLLTFSYHSAAVKAIAWSPHARGILASGGGTADRRIRFWNTMTNSALAAVDTGSQVCNLAWSKNVNEIVSTHGYSQNQIIVWKYPSLSKVVTLMGHSYRVLYLAVSPSGETIVTGAGDETLRFWNVFPAARNQRGNCENSSLLSPMRMNIR